MVTLLTVQNTLAVESAEHIDADLVRRQFSAVTSDLPPAAAKSGALGSPGLIEAVASCVTDLCCPLVVDPVMVSKHGHELISSKAVDLMRDVLLPQAYLVTPNRYEAEKLTHVPVNDTDSMKKAAVAIRQLGAQNVLIKGGVQNRMAVDLLLTDEQFVFLKHEYKDSRSTHGSGCALSAAVTASLALGHDLVDAVSAAKSFVTRGIAHAEPIGSGIGPLNFHVAAECPTCNGVSILE